MKIMPAGLRDSGWIRLWGLACALAVASLVFEGGAFAQLTLDSIVPPHTGLENSARADWPPYPKPPPGWMDFDPIRADKFTFTFDVTAPPPFPSPGWDETCLIKENLQVCLNDPLPAEPCTADPHASVQEVNYILNDTTDGKLYATIWFDRYADLGERRVRWCNTGSCPGDPGQCSNTVAFNIFLYDPVIRICDPGNLDPNKCNPENPDIALSSLVSQQGHNNSKHQLVGPLWEETSGGTQPTQGGYWTGFFYGPATPYDYPAECGLHEAWVLHKDGTLIRTDQIGLSGDDPWPTWAAQLTFDYDPSSPGLFPLTGFEDDIPMADDYLFFLFNYGSKSKIDLDKLAAELEELGRTDVLDQLEEMVDHMQADESSKVMPPLDCPMCPWCKGYDVASFFVHAGHPKVEADPVIIHTGLIGANVVIPGHNFNAHPDGDCLDLSSLQLPEGTQAGLSINSLHIDEVDQIALNVTVPANAEVGARPARLCNIGDNKLCADPLAPGFDPDNQSTWEYKCSDPFQFLVTIPVMTVTDLIPEQSYAGPRILNFSPKGSGFHQTCINRVRVVHPSGYTIDMEPGWQVAADGQSLIGTLDLPLCAPGYVYGIGGDHWYDLEVWVDTSISGCAQATNPVVLEDAFRVLHWGQMRADTIEPNSGLQGQYPFQVEIEGTRFYTCTSNVRYFDSAGQPVDEKLVKFEKTAQQTTKITGTVTINHGAPIGTGWFEITVDNTQSGCCPDHTKSVTIPFTIVPATMGINAMDPDEGELGQLLEGVIIDGFGFPVPPPDCLGSVRLVHSSDPPTGNVARGKSYTKSQEPYGYYPDTGNSESTDGILSGGWWDHKSYGYRLPQVNNEITLDIVVDLESIYFVDQVKYHDYEAGNKYQPDTVTVYTSTDGSSYALQGSTQDSTQTATGKWFTVDFSNIDARYVKVQLYKKNTGGGSDWLFVDEIEVSGSSFANLAVIDGNTIEGDLTVPPDYPVGTYDVYVRDDCQDGCTDNCGTWEAIGPGLFTLRAPQLDIESVHCLDIPISPPPDPMPPCEIQPGTTNVDVTIEGGIFVGECIQSIAFDTLPGVTVDDWSLVNPNKLTVEVDVASNAPLGWRDLTITYKDDPLCQGWTGSYDNALLVVAPEPKIKEVDPNRGIRGWTGDVRISGKNFTEECIDGVVFSGSGITVNSSDFDRQTQQVTANITIADDAPLGWRNVTVDYSDRPGCEDFDPALTGTNGFRVVRLRLRAVRPAQGMVGDMLTDVNLMGNNMDDVTADCIDFGPDIAIVSSTVINSSLVFVTIDIGHTALGPRDVTICDPWTSATCPGCFTVNAPPPNWGTVPFEFMPDREDDPIYEVPSRERCQPGSTVAGVDSSGPSAGTWLLVLLALGLLLRPSRMRRFLGTS